MFPKLLPVIPAIRGPDNFELFPFPGGIKQLRKLPPPLEFLKKTDFAFMARSGCRIGILVMIDHQKDDVTQEERTSYLFANRIIPLSKSTEQEQLNVEWAFCQEINPDKNRFQSDKFQQKLKYLSGLIAAAFCCGSKTLKQKLEQILQIIIKRKTEQNIGFFIDGEADRINEFVNIPSIEPKLRQVFEELNIETRLDLIIQLYEHVVKLFGLLFETSTEETEAETMDSDTQTNQPKSPEKTEKDEFENKIKDFPKTIKNKIKEHYETLKTIPPQSAEYTTAKTYLSWLVKIPWSTKTEDTKDFVLVKKVLENNHYGLRTVKDRIIEFLAIRKLNPKGKGPILCLVGPPGTGKTSIGESIANALGREFARISLGGMHDEAEIRGHRRTYIGALPSRIMQEIVKAGSMNPVFMLDEVDKIGHDFRGDPAAALLEVTDPEQNFNFVDNYLGPDFPVDLSRVLFIATANISDSILPAFLNRMECIELPGYDWEDKLEIAKGFLVPKQLEECGFTEENLEKAGIAGHIPAFSDGALMTIIQDYTFDAGARRTEQEIQKILRKQAASLVVSGEPNQTPENKILLPQNILTSDDVKQFLGDPPTHNFREDVERFPPGVGPILTVDQNGIGNLDFAEAKIIASNPSDQLGGNLFTGNLAEILKESIAVAISRIEKILPPGKIEGKHFHFHHDSAAIRKDGPSAGIAYYAMLYSLLIETPLKPLVAMTGELPLKREAVFPIGGLKAKIFAAERSKYKEVIVPKENMPELKKLPPGITKKLEIIVAQPGIDFQSISQTSRTQYKDKMVVYCVETPEQALAILFPDHYPPKNNQEK